MERIHTLIDKLSQQKAQGASPAHLLFTVQLLQQELLHLQKATESVSTKKVAVLLPFNTAVTVSEIVFQTPVVEAEEKEIYVLDAVVDEAEEEPLAVVSEPLYGPREYTLRKPPVEELFAETKPTPKEEALSSYANHSFSTAFDTAVEAPTLAQYTTTTEVHEKIAEKKDSLNDRLKREQTELAQLLKEAPIKDLRKGIGINDRFAFVRELFRGDEAAYERSIKTINNFNIYSEAEYWISRELKMKLGWDDRSETAQHFYQLVRRRFS